MTSIAVRKRWAEQVAADARVDGLRRRTVAVGWVTSGFGLGALLCASMALTDLGTWWLTRGNAAAPHIPGSLGRGWNDAAITLVAVALAVVGAWGISTGRLNRRQSLGTLGLCVLVALADVVLAPSFHRPMFSFPSRIERLILARQYEDADRIAMGVDDSHPRLYLRAQIALRRGDRPQLEALARPLLEASDAFVYVSGQDYAMHAVYLQTIGDLRIGVLAALERGLTDQPLSAASLAPAGLRDAVGPAWSLGLAKLVAALMLAASFIALVRVWRRMRENSLRVAELDFRRMLAVKRDAPAARAAPPDGPAAPSESISRAP